MEFDTTRLRTDRRTADSGGSVLRKHICGSRNFCAPHKLVVKIPLIANLQNANSDYTMRS